MSAQEVVHGFVAVPDAPLSQLLFRRTEDGIAVEWQGVPIIRFSGDNIGVERSPLWPYPGSKLNPGETMGFDW